MGGTPSAPKTPKFKPVDISQAEEGFQQYQTLGYNLADQDFLARFPGLVAQRDANIARDAAAITGPLPTTLENQYTTNALAQALQTGAGGTGGSIGGAGSFGRGDIAANVTNQVSDYQDFARQNMQQDLADNPARVFSLSPDDVVNMAVGNTMGANAQRFQAYAGNVAASNAAQAAQSQELFAGAGLAISLAGTIAMIA